MSRMTIDEFSHCNNGACFNRLSVAASKVNVHERFSKSLVVLLLRFGCFDVSLNHSCIEKTSAKHCTRSQSFSLREMTIAEEAGSCLEASWGIAKLPTIVNCSSLCLAVHTSLLHATTYALIFASSSAELASEAFKSYQNIPLPLFLTTQMISMVFIACRL